MSSLHNSLRFDTEPHVGAVISGGLLSCSPQTSLRQACLLMHQARVSCILVMEADQVLGIWTEGDLHRLELPGDLQRPIGQLMQSPVHCIGNDQPLGQAALLMKRHKVRRLLVVNSLGQARGVLTQTDLIRFQGVEHYLLMRDLAGSVRREPVIVAPVLPLGEALAMMGREGVDALVVKGPEAGILTERDLVAWLAHGKGQVAADLARFPLYALHQATSLMTAVQQIQTQGYRHLGVLDDDGQLKGLLSYSDILANIEYEYVSQLRDLLDERDQALRSSVEHLRLARQVINASLDGIMITDAGGHIESVNPSFSQMTGYRAEEVVGKSPGLLSSGRHSPDFYQAMWAQLAEQGFWQGEIWNRRKNGEVYPEWLTITAIRDDEGQIRKYAGIFTDISDRKQKEARIQSLAYYDELTGLPNRRLFMDRLQLAIANARRHHHQVALLFVDLDLFKRINDSLGHLAGDLVLKEVARRLQQTVREGDSVARLGGDEFTVLVSEIDDAQGLERLAQRLINALYAPMEVAGRVLFVSASIGISLFPGDGRDEEQLLRFADTAMYRSKELGRNKFRFYNSQMSEQNRQEMLLEERLHHALTNRTLEVYYQPKVDLASGTLTGLEALLRWHDEVLGTVSPARVIPLAERLGLIEAVGAQVLDKVCAQLAAWSHLDRVPVAVNLSVLQLHSDRFLAELDRCLAQHGIPPQLIELEITESCLMPERADAMLALLEAIRARGIQLSIDDFGTGYSSLAYLRKLPLNTLKLDRSFVQHLPHSAEDVEISLAVLGLARGLGLQVIAEGVETPEQANFLAQHQCGQGQGYLYSPALPAHKAAEWLTGQAWLGGQ
ncbi:EAL domain-containing protein [Gallaecimonas xiamenensis]|uniref:diguanylate cyclase n=1 Tax=Gallaecimonas xiamenensis 3-C-1 TaxID=745411 RepID=K2J3G3_9GAMM|nr:EAL domain-containing protein [Gallaecimonas xiamenensis]EKE69603.1 signal transduction protein [Gallaecimonas xiamenensis 3-C-1]